MILFKQKTECFVNFFKPKASEDHGTILLPVSYFKILPLLLQFAFTAVVSIG